MTKCCDMKKGHIYKCNECGLEFEITKECCSDNDPNCKCHSKKDSCSFICCSKDISKK